MSEFAWKICLEDRRLCRAPSNCRIFPPKRGDTVDERNLAPVEYKEHPQFSKDFYDSTIYSLQHFFHQQRFPIENIAASLKPPIAKFRTPCEPLKHDNDSKRALLSLWDREKNKKICHPLKNIWNKVSFFFLQFLKYTPSNLKNASTVAKRNIVHPNWNFDHSEKIGLIHAPRKPMKQINMDP